MTITTVGLDAGPARRRTDRLRVALIVGGFPDAEHPISNVFGVRTAQALTRETQLSTIVLRAWLPRRPLRRTESIQNLRVTTIAVPQWPQATIANLLVYQNAGWRLVRSILKDVDVVHSGDLSSLGVIAGRWARRAGKPHVTQATQCMSRVTVPHLWGRALDGWQRDVDAIACNSDALRREVDALWPDLPEVRTVYRGVDLALFHPQGPVFAALPQARDGARFLYAGGFPAYPLLPHAANTKGGFTLLAAWASNEASLHAAGATLVVAGPDCGRADVLAWHSRLRYRDSVKILGPVLSELMPSLIRAADAVVVPSLQEGLPNIAVETSASGRAVLGSDIPPMREVVVPWETGRLVPAGDANAWSKALLQAAHERSALAAYGEAGRLRMEATFDQRSYAARMIEMYETALRRFDRRPLPAGADIEVDD
jgi:glycosyltransferase involved in cell wall biosynthesis